MKIMLTCLTILLFVFSWVASAAENEIRIEALNSVPNAVGLEEGLVGGGPPGKEGLAQLKEQGIMIVIDVRDPKEGVAEEWALASALGMNYYNIPVTLDNFSVAQAGQIADILEKPGSKPALLHCASGNRAVGIWALYQNKHRGVPADKALAEAEDRKSVV